MPGSELFEHPLAYLPVELLSKIAYEVPERHERFGYVVDARPLASLARVSQVLRGVAQSVLFREVIITSEHQLHALVNSPIELLESVRELNIFMDVEFYDVWRTWAFVRPFEGNPPLNSPSFQPNPDPYTSTFQSPFSALAFILSRTPQLRALRLQVAESSGPRSAWHKFALSRAFGIPFGQALEDAFTHEGVDAPTGSRDSRTISLAHMIPLSQLTHLALDSFIDLEPLLALTPKLQSLALSITSGFPQNASRELVEALTRTGAGQNLKELVFTPDSLRIDGAPGNVVDMILGVVQQEQFEEDGGESPNPFGDVNWSESDGSDNSSMDLVDTIGKACPNLEVLDLRSYWHGEDVHFLPYLETVTIRDLYRALVHLPNLRSLALPTSIMTEKDLLTLRLPLRARAASRADLANILIARRRAIESVEKLEALTLQGTVPSGRSEHEVVHRNSREQAGLAAVAPDLKQVSFVRPLIASDMTDSCVTYQLAELSPPLAETHSSTSHNATTSNVFSKRLVIVASSVSRASPLSAWPYAPALSLTYTLSKIWGTNSPSLRSELALAYLQDHQPLVLLLAGAGGAVIGQVGINGLSSLRLNLGNFEIDWEGLRSRLDIGRAVGFSTSTGSSEGGRVGEKMLVAGMLAGSAFYAASRVLKSRSVH